MTVPSRSFLLGGVAETRAVAECSLARRRPCPTSRGPLNVFGTQQYAAGDMPERISVVTTVLFVLLGSLAAGCSAADRPTVRGDASKPTSCAAAVAAAFPGGRPGTLPAYREVERLCPSLAELAEREAFNPEILRLDCAPADVLALGREIPPVGREVPTAPPDLIDTAVCRQFNAECADYDEIRRDHAALARTPTLANLGLYVRHRALFEACKEKYG